MATTEERLAALEAKLAQLTATTPTTYYTHQYSGEEIDNAVSRALPNGAIDQAAGTFVRPNLLDNWYFGRPVNQRGLTSYSGTTGYFIDRWQRDAGLLTTLGEDGIVCTRTSTGNNDFFSKLENYVVLAGARVTLSALVKGSVGSEVTLGYNVGAGSVYADYTACTGDWQLVAFTFYISDEPSQLSVIAHSGFDAGFAGESVIWRAAKLELGPTQTLAHRDGDMWILNEVPDYGEQLRRCQRYFIRSSAKQYFSGATYASTSGCLLVPTPVQMRATPVISIREKSRIITSSGVYGFDSLIVENADPSGVKLIVNGTGFPIDLFVLADTTFDLSADL